jgi:hypothetical protein
MRRQRVFGIETLIETGFDSGDLPPRITLSYTQRMRHSVHFLPAGKGQHPVRILLQFRHRIPRPDLTNLISQAGVKAVVIKKRNDYNLFGDRPPRLYQSPRAFFRKHISEFFEIPLSENFVKK